VGLVFLGVISAQVRMKPLLDLDGVTSEPSLSPDGKTLAFSWCQPDYSACGVYTRLLDGGAVHLLAGTDKEEGLATVPRWSPTGNRIAFARVYSHFENRLFVRDNQSGAERDFGLICDRALESSWTPDGRFLVASVYTEDPPRTFDCRPMLFSAQTGKRDWRMAPLGGVSAFSPNGRMLVYANGNALMLARLNAGYQPVNPGRTLAREPREISRVVWTADGTQISISAGATSCIFVGSL
jgi:Tol biopolymer transport system component